MQYILQRLFFFFFNDTATTEIYTLSLHDALPIFRIVRRDVIAMLIEGHRAIVLAHVDFKLPGGTAPSPRSEEHTSELQSQSNLVCRLLLEKKNKIRGCVAVWPMSGTKITSSTVTT